MNRKVIILTLFILSVVMSIGILTFSLTLINQPGNSGDESLLELMVQQSPTSTLTTNKKVTLSLKYSDFDKEPSLRFNINIQNDILVEDSTYEGVDAKKIISPKGYIIFSLSHMALPQEYTNLTTIKKDMHRATIENTKIRYADNLELNRNCREDSIVTKPPCGTPVYNYMIIECSSTEAISFCDDIMKSLEIINP